MNLLHLRRRQQHNSANNNNNEELPTRRRISARLMMIICKYCKYPAIAILFSVFLYSFVSIGIYLGEVISESDYTSMQEITKTKPSKHYFNNLYWSDLDKEARGAASKLGYNKEYWDHDEYPPIFDIPFANLNSNEKEAARHLHLVGNFPLFHTKQNNSTASGGIVTSEGGLNSTVQHKIPDDNDDYAAGWNAMANIKRNKQWGLQHTKVLKSIILPLWIDAPKDASDDDRLGDIWLPPRLQIDDEIRTLEYGVLFCAIGSIGFAKKQVVPMIRHLHENLGIPDAQGRAALREKGVHLKSRHGFALVTNKQFVEGPLKDWVSFFDAIYLVEDLPAYPFDWQSVTNSDAMVKATKVHVMASSPFDTTIMLDLDSFPCQHDFALPLLAVLGESDIAFRNIVEEMEAVKDSRHFLGEHNSAVAVLNMRSIRTRMLLALYIQAYHRTGEMSKTEHQRDQPSLLVAMQSMAEEFTPNDGRPAEIPNDSVRAVIDRHKLGFIQHADLDFSLVCSNSAKLNTCGQSSSCVISHKAPGLYMTEAKWGDALSTKKEEGREEKEELTKYFGIGFKKTGTTTLDSMFSHLINTIGGSRPSEKDRARAVSTLIASGNENIGISLSLALARNHHYFQDAPWQDSRLYRQLAILYPTARFILTIREPEEWYKSVVNFVQGQKKMERYRAIFGANSTSREDFISAFVLHNEAVRQFFVEELKQPHRLLEMDLTEHKDGTGWVKFCEFVGLSEEQCPTGDVPHENKTPSIRREPETISRLPSMRMILFVSTCAMLVFAKAKAQWRMQIIHYAVCPVLLFWFILELFKVGILIGAYLQVQMGMHAMLEQTKTDDGDTTNPFMQRLLENREPKCSIHRPKDMQSTYIAIARAGSTTLHEGFDHHDHDCTLKDMEQRGFRYVLLPLRHPLARISSGLSRRFEGKTLGFSGKESNRIIYEMFQNRTNGADDFLTSLRSETDPHHEAVISSILGPKNQNYMLPITHFYLKNYTGHVNVAFLCIETLLDDYHAAFRRWGIEPPKALPETSIRNKSKVSSGNTTTLMTRFSKQNIDWVEQTYSNDVALYKKHCPDGFREINRGLTT